jgi:hypothetical protein
VPDLHLSRAVPVGRPRALRGLTALASTADQAPEDIVEHAAGGPATDQATKDIVEPATGDAGIAPGT